MRGANGQTGGKNRSSTFVLTAFISFGLFNVFGIILRCVSIVLCLFCFCEGEYGIWCGLNLFCGVVCIELAL